MMGERLQRHGVVVVLQSTAVGGMESHAVDLAGEYVRRGLPTRVVVPEGPAFDGVARRAHANGARVTRANTDGRDGRVGQLRRWWHLARVLVTSRAAAVHLHTGGATGGLAVLITARLLTGAAVVLTEHDVPGPEPSVRQKVTRRLVDHCCHTVVGVSRRNARRRRQRLGMG
ncbi:MAG: glycosyltransferase, partial [Dehalococcoidia bacterium]|nr:glycosyltransferase [Dehalococcoidia bacterium]